MKKKVLFAVYVILTNILSWYLWLAFCSAIWTLLYKNNIMTDSYAFINFVDIILYYLGISLRAFFVFLIPYRHQKKKKLSTNWNMVQKIYLIYLMVKMILDRFTQLSQGQAIIPTAISMIISLTIDISIIVILIKKAYKRAKKTQIDLFADITEEEEA